MLGGIDGGGKLLARPFALRRAARVRSAPAPSRSRSCRALPALFLARREQRQTRDTAGGRWPIDDRSKASRSVEAARCAAGDLEHVRRGEHVAVPLAAATLAGQKAVHLDVAGAVWSRSLALLKCAALSLRAPGAALRRAVLVDEQHGVTRLPKHLAIALALRRAVVPRVVRVARVAKRDDHLSRATERLTERAHHTRVAPLLEELAPDSHGAPLLAPVEFERRQCRARALYDAIA
mmetsp:Transcript_40552/g.100154  ORF Transcript_40552/g.100154 Transcript_40552/m.100154 type:complete len:236 (+) Transcript_40552:1003-1710(+)